MTLTAAKIARHFASDAKVIYARDGTVLPMLTIVDAKGFGLLMHPSGVVSDHPGEAAATVVAMMGKMMPTRFIALVVESFIKEYAAGSEAEAAERDIQRGDLTRMAETDPHVHTAITVSVWDVGNPSEGHCVIAKEKGDPRQPEWEDIDLPGRPNGYLDDVIQQAWEFAEPIAGLGLSSIAQAILIAGLAEVCVELEGMEGLQ